MNKNNKKGMNKNTQNINKMIMMLLLLNITATKNTFCL